MIKSEKGQSLVEMALILPLLLLLMVGIFDIGRVLYTQIHLHLTTQETVRLGGLGATDSEMVTFAKNYVHGDGSKLVVNITPNNANRVSGNYVTVTLEYPLQLMTPLISSLFSNVKLVADSTIRIE